MICKNDLNIVKISSNITSILYFCKIISRNYYFLYKHFDNLKTITFNQLYQNYQNNYSLLINSKRKGFRLIRQWPLVKYYKKIREFKKIVHEYVYLIIPKIII